MTEGSEPIHELGIQDAEGNFTALAALDYDTVNDELSLKHLQQNVELRTDGTSWNANRPLGDETQPVPGTSHFESVEAEKIVNGSVFAGNYDGGNVDERLTNALEDAPNGSTILLEDAVYNANRTISKPVRLKQHHRFAARIDATWTAEDAIWFDGVSVSGDGLVALNATRCRFEKAINISSSDIDVNVDECFILGIRGGSVTFESGTEGGIVDSCTGTSVTDNGTNTVGDIA